MEKNININKTLMENIKYYGKIFCEEILNEYSEKKLENSWWEALKFFFEHSFYRGRRDELSDKYRKFTIKALENYLNINEGLDNVYTKLKDQKEYFEIECLKSLINRYGKKNITNNDNFKKIRDDNPIIKNLTSPEEKDSLKNIEDIMMILDVLNFIIKNENRKNIYNYLKQKIINSEVKQTYNELIRIRAIGDKIASLIIRDIGLISRETSEIIKKTPEFAFPIDTLIRNKIAPKFREEKFKDDKEIKKFFINKCQEYSIDDTLEFAAGLWYIASNSLYISLDLLSKLNND